MTLARRGATLVTAVILALLVASAVGLAVARDRLYGEPQPGAPVLYVRSPGAMRRIALSFAPMLADLYWIRTLQYYGSTRLSTRRTKNYDLLYPLLDITTTLDPRFKLAYRFGAIFLAEPYPGGAGRPDLAVALLEKGYRQQPQGWWYLQDIGFVYYWWVGDYPQAAAWFEKAAAIPGAPWWLKSLAAATLTQGGDRTGSRLLWQSLLATADNDWLRQNAQVRLAQLDALDAIDQLQAVVRSYASRVGAFPSSWEALVRSGYLRAVPVDPSGTGYLLDAQTGVVSLSPDSRLFPLPTGGRIQSPAR